LYQEENARAAIPRMTQVVAEMPKSSSKPRNHSRKTAFVDGLAQAGVAGVESAVEETVVRFREET
jgi:hypothetical protein